MPSIPTSAKASLTSSNLNGLMIASIFFISVYRLVAVTGANLVCRLRPTTNGIWLNGPLAARMPEWQRASHALGMACFYWGFLPAKIFPVSARCCELSSRESFNQRGGLTHRHRGLRQKSSFNAGFLGILIVFIWQHIYISLC